MFNRLRSSAVNVGQSVLLTSLVVTGLIAGLRAVGFFERPELAFYDQFIRLQPDLPLDDRLLIVGIDEFDLQALQEWPISDLSMAKLLETLQTHQPRVIGVDILRDIPIGEGRDQLVQQLKQQNVVIVCKVNSVDGPGVPPPAELPRESAVFSDLVVDPGGILRRNLIFLNPPPSADPSVQPHACNTPDTLVSLSFGTALKFLAAEGISASVNEDNQLQIGSTLLPALTPNFGSYQGTDAGGYQVMLRYRAEDAVAPTVSLMDVLEGRVDDALIRDRIVLIGYTTPLAKDDFYTPYSIGRDDQQKMPGVIVHGHSVSQLLSVALDGRSLIMAWSLPLELLWMMGWALAAGFFAWYIRHPAWFSSGVLVIGGAAYGISLLLFIHGVWIPIFPTLVGIAMTSAGVVLFDRFYNSDYGKRVVKQVKTFLHIDIDQEKLSKQVTEITETDYFQDLKSTVKTLRANPPTPQSKSNLNPSSPSKLTFIPPKTAEGDRPPAAAEPPIQPQPNASPVANLDGANESSSDEFDYFADLGKEAKQLKNQPDDELDYFADLNQEAQRLKNQSDPDSSV